MLSFEELTGQTDWLTDGLTDWLTGLNFLALTCVVSPLQQLARQFQATCSGLPHLFETESRDGEMACQWAKSRPSQSLESTRTLMTSNAANVGRSLWTSNSCYCISIKIQVEWTQQRWWLATALNSMAKPLNFQCQLHCFVGATALAGHRLMAKFALLFHGGLPGGVALRLFIRLDSMNCLAELLIFQKREPFLTLITMSFLDVKVKTIRI